MADVAKASRLQAAGGMALGLVLAALITGVIVGGLEGEADDIGFTDAQLTRIEAMCEDKALHYEGDGFGSYATAYEHCDAKQRHLVNVDAPGPG
jgi:hypothetical protein